MPTRREVKLSIASCQRSLRLTSPYYDCRAALSIHTFISLFRVDITPKNRKGLQAQKPTAEHLLRTRVLNVLPSTSPTKPTKLKPTCSLTVALTRDDRDKMFSKCGGLVLLEYCSFTTLVPKKNMATQNAKRTVLRSQNRTRDLSVTMNITAERDTVTMLESRINQSDDWAKLTTNYTKRSVAPNGCAWKL